MPGYDPQAHHRRSVRLVGYDYSQAGCYFVTICTHNRTCLLGEIIDGVLAPSRAGDVVQSTWQQLPSRFPGIELDAFVLMPNHIHGILIILPCDNLADDRPVGAQFIAPSVGRSFSLSEQGRANSPPHHRPHHITRTGHDRHEGAMNCAPTVGQVVRTLKAASTRRIRRGADPGFAWQRNYYEHIIRNETSLDRIREYIINNSLQWELDQLHPNNPSKW